MDPSKANSRMDNNGYNNYFANAYKNQQNRMMIPFSDASYHDPHGAGHDAGYLNQQIGFGNPMGLGEGIATSGFENIIPPNDQNMNYYQEYCRLFIANVVLTTQMKELVAEKNELLTRIAELERGEKTTEDQNSTEFMTEKKSRLRRKAAEIERHYICPSETCQKKYGSEGSLMQHVKLKHPDLTQDPDWKMKILNKSEASESNANCIYKYQLANDLLIAIFRDQRRERLKKVYRNIREQILITACKNQKA